MGEEAALTHAELLGERADGEALEALRGGDINGAREDGFASTRAFGLVGKGSLVDRLSGALACGLADGLTGGFSDGTGAQSDRH